jgi:hypothetical protein
MSLPCAAEILTVRIDEMIPLPLHHRVRLNGVFKTDKLHSKKYSNEELDSKSKDQLQAVLTDFKRYFEINFPVILDENLNGFEDDVSNAASYLFIRPLELRLFLSGYTGLDQTVASIIDRHSLLIDFSLRVLEKSYANFAEYQEALRSMGISEDSYLWWASSLHLSIRDYIFMGIYSSFAA